MSKLLKSNGIKALLLLCLFTITIAFNSCNSNSDSKTIKFWHFWSEPNQRQVINELIKQFEKENNCKVETAELSWNDGKTKLFAAFNSKTAPDVLELGSDWIAQFSSALVLSEMNKDTIDYSKFIDFSVNPCVWQNKYYAVPWIVDTRVLFYNKDLMKSAGLEQNPPKTFAEMLQFAEKISLLKDKYGWGANSSDAHRLYKKIIPMFWSNGGNIFDESGNLVLNSEQNIGALNMYLALSRTGYLETQKLIDAAFTEGKIGFWYSGGWLLEKIKNENPNLNFGVAMIPGFNSENGISFAGGEYLAISKQSTKQELALKFVKFMTNGVNSIKFCKKITEAGFPADKNYFMDKYFSESPYKSVFASQLKFARMTPVHPKWLDIEAIIENATVEVLFGRKSSGLALSDAQSDINKLIQKK